MKKFSMALGTMAMLFGLLSCSKSDNPGSDYEPNPVGIPTNIGTVLPEAASSATIGAGGGVLTSTDGRLSIQIPAGAFTEDQEVKIQAITDENPLGKEKAYRLEPHDVEFQQPVTISFYYESEDHAQSMPEALAVAYQDEDRIWQAVGGAVLNKAEQSVSITTTHFSDWSFFESFKLVPSATTVAVGGTVQLELWSAMDLIVPLVPGEEAPIGEEEDMTAEFIRKWNLAGAGNLQSNGSKATYKAPGTVPNAPNPVAISVDLDFKNGKRLLVVTHILIVNDDGEIEVSVAGGPFKKKFASPVVKLQDNLYAFGDSDGDEEGSYVYVMFEGGIGTHAFKQPTVQWGTHTHYHITGGNEYSCYYVDDVEGLKKSGGGVTITSMGEDDGFVKGTFEINPAGWGPELRNTTTVSGKFRVKKGW